LAAGPIRVLVADDHEVVRGGLRLFLDLQDGLEVVGEAENGAAAARLVESAEPDVVVMDLSMPGVDGIEATRLVRQARPGVRVLILSSFVDERVIPALRAGADGYLTKDSGAEQLAEAIRAVHRGDPVFCQEAVRRVTRELVRTTSRPTGTVTVVFTDIEGSTEVLERLGEQPARELFREHDDVVRSLVERYSGTEVEQEGDSFMLAFAGARPAVGCACEIQRALAGHSLAVRMGLNTGDVVDEDDRYFGRTVYLAARISGQARGGEILVSDVTRALVGELQGVGFADRGEHDLRGLSGRHRLWEVEWRT
jgi:DNA-binding NarL/FixJ family response regulator